jgi:hypothetical protein
MELAQLDNEMVIEAMLRAGQSVPDTVDELGIPYHPASPDARGRVLVLWRRGAL